ncbi:MULTISPECIES: phage tail sheath family protein [Streptosporangium]|uniref:Phage tail sheath protein FI n=1 Tax=Streptosporangium brasiliense TaxID=47480 RepID=A0ABT9RLZ9_9ACTN|nr:phage tail sheath C-terminal domain-containing protein [Streptosporangium brasiliense]MDP9870324.1 phage tail sheath protein FI [Streptosporangium brasiliense]
MATYLTPGVYVEENLAPANRGDGSASRAIGAFVGLAPKGPTIPTRVRSWAQYVNLFGGFSGSNGSYLPYAVYTFFSNGGGSCFIVRTTRSDAVAAKADLMDSTTGTPLAGFQVTALAEGSWSNTTSVRILPTGATRGRFDLQVIDDGRVAERFGDMSSDPNDPRYVISIVNSPYAGSLLVKLTNKKITEAYVYDEVKDIIPAQSVTLTGGADGTGPYDYVENTKLLADVPGATFDLNLPAISDPNIINPIVDWASKNGRVFVVIDGPRAAEGATSAQVMQGYQALVEGPTSLLANSYAGVYGPWLMCSDPASSMFGAVRLLPPGGAVIGQMAKTDVFRHVAKAPAGIETVLANVLSAEARFTEPELDILGDAHINVIRMIPGYGHCIFGSRTLKRELPDKYVPVRRFLIYLRKSLSDQSRWAVFEPNGPDLWDRLRLSITHYLSMLRKAGMLQGKSDSEAFFVRCDGDNNPQSEINAGRVNVDIGVALRYPAEFVVIKIGQFDGGTDTNEEAIF